MIEVEPMLRIENLDAGYGREVILHGINVKFDKKTLLLGPNGSGKTTLFRTICGLTKKLKGRIFIDDQDLDTVEGEVGLLISNLPEIFRLVHFASAYHLAKLYLDLLKGDMDKFLEITSQFGLSEEFLRRRKMYKLSAGQQKIILNAIALATDAKVKLLDEPFEQLDPKRKDVLIEYLEMDKNVIILSTHETWLIKKLLETSWDVAFMFEGKIHGVLPLERLLNAYLYVGERDDSLLTIKTSAGAFSIVLNPPGKPLSDIFSLDYLYKLA